MIYDNILGTIGKTPIVGIQRLAPRHVTMYVKCEFFNPLASVKDRLAIAIIEDAERSGALKPGQTVVEATSGNTGIALAMVCAAKGYPFVATMAESFSVERRKIMRLMGAKVILTPAAERGSGMVRKAAELAKKHGWFLARQFENEANPAYHRNTTGPEILQDFAGRRLDYFVTGWGTGGTLTGAGEMVRLARPEVQIIASEPAGAALLSGKPFTPHKIQGWTPDFLPAVLKREVPHRIVTVTDTEAVESARALARSEGIFCGISSGATFAAALKVAGEAAQGAVILAMLPDTAERYLSTVLFEGLAAGEQVCFAMEHRLGEVLDRYVGDAEQRARRKPEQLSLPCTQRGASYRCPDEEPSDHEHRALRVSKLNVCPHGDRQPQQFHDQIKQQKENDQSGDDACGPELAG